MSIFDHFPYSNAYQLNLDWLLEAIGKVKKTAEDLESAVNILTQSVDSAVAEQLNKWLEDGTLALLLEGVKNVQKYGAKGDGITNDRESINKALSGGGVIYFPAGVYMVDGFAVGYNDTLIDKGLIVHSNSRIILNPKAEIKILQGTGNVRSVIFNIRGVENVEISGGIVTGDSATHQYTSGETDEWNHLMMISGSSNVRVHDMTLKNSTGDGVYIGQDIAQEEPAVNNRLITLANLVIDTIGRNGVSVGSVDGCLIDNCSVTNVYRTNPKAAVDVEKEGVFGNTLSVTDVTIRNLKTSQCGYSVLIHIADTPVKLYNMLQGNLLLANSPVFAESLNNALVQVCGGSKIINSTLRSFNTAGTGGVVHLVNCDLAIGDIDTYKVGRIIFDACTIPNANQYTIPCDFLNCRFILNDTNSSYLVYLGVDAAGSTIKNCTFVREIEKTISAVSFATGLEDVFVSGCTTTAVDVRGVFASNNGGEVVTGNDCRKWSSISGTALAEGCVNFN